MTTHTHNTTGNDAIAKMQLRKKFVAAASGSYIEDTKRKEREEELLARMWARVKEIEDGQMVTIKCANATIICTVEHSDLEYPGYVGIRIGAVDDMDGEWMPGYNTSEGATIYPCELHFAFWEWFKKSWRADVGVCWEIDKANW